MPVSAAVGQRTGMRIVSKVIPWRGAVPGRARLLMLTIGYMESYTAAEKATARAAHRGGVGLSQAGLTLLSGPGAARTQHWTAQERQASGLIPALIPCGPTSPITTEQVRQLEGAQNPEGSSSANLLGCKYARGLHLPDHQGCSAMILLPASRDSRKFI